MIGGEGEGSSGLNPSFSNTLIIIIAAASIGGVVVIALLIIMIIIILACVCLLKREKKANFNVSKHVEEEIAITNSDIPEKDELDVVVVGPKGSVGFKKGADVAKNGTKSSGAAGDAPGRRANGSNIASTGVGKETKSKPGNDGRLNASHGSSGGKKAKDNKNAPSNNREETKAVVGNNSSIVKKPSEHNASVSKSVQSSKSSNLQPNASVSKSVQSSRSSNLLPNASVSKSVQPSKSPNLPNPSVSNSVLSSRSAKATQQSANTASSSGSRPPRPAAAGGAGTSGPESRPKVSSNSNSNRPVISATNKVAPRHSSSTNNKQNNPLTSQRGSVSHGRGNAPVKHGAGDVSSSVPLRTTGTELSRTNTKGPRSAASSNASQARKPNRTAPPTPKNS